MVRHATPNVIEGKIVPLVIFVTALDMAGPAGAVLGSLAWTLLVLCYRVVSNQRVSGLIILGAISLGARSVLAVATGSLVVYFLQPVLTTVAIGLAFLVSAPLGRPLAAKLAHDFCPMDEATAALPSVRRFFTELSVMWAVTSIINAGVTLWLLTTQTTATFVTLKTFLGPAMAAIAVGTSVALFRRRNRAEGIAVRFGTPV